MSKDFYGLPTITLENAHQRIDALAQAGPRLVRALLHGISENQFAELPGLKIETPLGQYSMQGGHRLWHAPEAMPRTYISDDRDLDATIEDGVLTLTGSVEPFSNIRKTMIVTLLEDRPGLHIIQTLTNTGAWAVELACWSITQLPLGGMAFLPQPVHLADSDGLLPNRSLVLWPYTRWNDTRLHLHDDLLLMKGEAELPPLKVGYLNKAGWLGYLRNGIFFLKRLEKPTTTPFPDLGCNAEVYVNHLFLELETLGSLVNLLPGQSTTITETWEFFTELTHIPYSIKGARGLVNELGLAGS